MIAQRRGRAAIVEAGATVGKASVAGGGPASVVVLCMPYCHTYGMIKRTFVLDEESSAYLDRMAERTGMAKSQVVREALRVYGEQIGRLGDEERDGLLAEFDRTASEVPDRPRGEVEAELAEVARARRAGGRQRP